MNAPTDFYYQFFPVGQGLFSIGLLTGNRRHPPSFLWVYDCGTNSSAELLDKGIENLIQITNGSCRIDFLILSHFDKDHISGVVRLLENFKVGTLLLPYMPLEQRLVVYFEEGGGGADELAEFYLNPVAFLLARENQRIEQILFVPPSGSDGPAYPSDQPSDGDSGSGDELEVQFVPDSLMDSEDREVLARAAKDVQNGARVAFLQPGSRITIAKALWEFIPYNDDPVAEISEEFVRQVVARRDVILSARDALTRCDLLSILKQTYDCHFGSRGKKRNVISLFLYSGPIYASWRECLLDRCNTNGRIETCWEFYCAFPECVKPPSQACSILYSGDGYLDKPDRLRNLVGYLNHNRVERVGVFQVMHHGAQANWHRGVAKAIAPLFSVFCSDPNHEGLQHPHPLVLRDFWPYGAVQVDETNAFKAFGDLKI